MTENADRWLGLGAILGGVISVNFLSSPEPVAISSSTIEFLSGVGIDYPASDAKGLGFFPTSFYNFTHLPGLLLAIAGGFLVGFGARYGQGCTSGHAISGLSNLQIPSLVAVIGFFLGGLFSTFVLLPLILS